ncbi:hypothetical protein VIGAN_10106100 [Vigna angularis var. angularis]|uniref:Uncharacterized protein n=1 Tax=Vigna angularis var. angularis TaxID=157739 RepID=A0A0S3T3K6_PHAAN|nr:hypothetical protein VIGAN_10106100 [Vigna angularis var. angularis]
MRTKPPPLPPSPTSGKSLHTDHTGTNISHSVFIAGEYTDLLYSHDTHLTRLSVQEVIATVVRTKPFPVDHHNG